MVKRFNLNYIHKRILSKKMLFKVLNYIDSNPGVRTPLLFIDKDRLIENTQIIGARIQNSQVFYAVKANGDPKVLSILKDLDIGFEIASLGELSLLKKLGVSSKRIITSNPVKSIEFIEALYSYGVRYFVFDSISEIEKLEKFAPGAQCYVRLSVPNEGSEWPLSKKFGVEIEDGLALLKRVKQGGILVPAGVTFHVGSQCLNPYNWCIAIDKAKRLFELCKTEGIYLKFLNIGGGYPISYTKVAPKIKEIEEKIHGYLKEKFHGKVKIFLEPGRAVVGECGIMITKVIGVAKRGYENWAYLDVGVFNGLMEAIGGIKYSYVPEKIGDEEDNLLENEQGFFEKAKKWVLAGPSCDSMDVIEKNVFFEQELRPGQTVLIPSAGAYTTSYASEFNGFPVPLVVII